MVNEELPSDFNASLCFLLKTWWYERFEITCLAATALVHNWTNNPKKNGLQRRRGPPGKMAPATAERSGKDTAGFTRAGGKACDERTGLEFGEN